MARFSLPLRIAQLVIAIIILGLTAYAVSAWWWATSAPSTINFNLFCAVWTVLASIFLLLAASILADSVFGHKFVVLAAELLTALFWFAAWVALASWLAEPWSGRDNAIRSSLIAACIFGAIEWILFTITAVFSALHCWRTRGDASSKPDPAMRVDARV